SSRTWLPPVKPAVLDRSLARSVFGPRSSLLRRPSAFGHFGRPRDRDTLPEDSLSRSAFDFVPRSEVVQQDDLSSTLPSRSHAFELPCIVLVVTCHLLWACGFAPAILESDSSELPLKGDRAFVGRVAAFDRSALNGFGVLASEVLDLECLDSLLRLLSFPSHRMLPFPKFFRGA